MSIGTWEAHLDIANTVRFARSTIKRELRACGDKHTSFRLCAQHIADPVAELVAMTAFDLISACYRSGATVALKTLNAAGVSPGVKIGHPDRLEPGSLTARQREGLIVVLNAGPVLRGPSRRRLTVPVIVAAVPPQRREPPKPRLTPEPDTPGPSLSRWCPSCAEWALPMRNGTCGFCDTLIEDAA